MPTEKYDDIRDNLFFANLHQTFQVIELYCCIIISLLQHSQNKIDDIFKSSKIGDVEPE